MHHFDSKMSDSRFYLSMNKNTTPKTITGNYYYSIVEITDNFVLRYDFVKSDFEEYVEHMEEKAPARWAVYTAGNPWRISDDEKSIHVDSLEFLEIVLPGMISGGFHQSVYTAYKIIDQGARPRASESAAPAQARALDHSLFRRSHIIGPLAKGESVSIDDESMGYLSGFLEVYLPSCPWLGNDDQLTSVVQFHQAATQRALTRMFDFSDVVRNTVAYANAAKDGQTDSRRFIETYGCEGRVAETFTAGLTKTVQVARGSGSGSSRFVRSCANTRLNQGQCTCLAELGRGVFPGIDRTVYDSRTTIKSIVNRNPLLGLMIGVQCGISDY